MLMNVQLDSVKTSTIIAWNGVVLDSVMGVNLVYNMGVFLPPENVSEC
jgi:hypothetical protein